VIEKMDTSSPRNPPWSQGPGRGRRRRHRHAPAVVNAAVDALAIFVVTHVDMPLTAEKLWQRMRG
jgi:hypothetical protein